MFGNAGLRIGNGNGNDEEEDEGIVDGFDDDDGRGGGSAGLLDSTWL